jgi:23S rRNA-/tRNA-specific pseudouridylate synthase
VPERQVAEPAIVHRDDELLVVSKPPGLPTTAPSPAEPSLVRWVSNRFPVLRAHPTSRLDAQVSGVVTFALSREANRRLLAARRAGAYERLYLGITVSEVSVRDTEWSWPISIDPEDSKRRVAGPGRGERAARTQVEIAVQHAHATLLRLRPATGRTHQLRVHAAKAGVPLFGDRAYGGEPRKVLPDGRVVAARRVLLHCARVCFPSASGGDRMELHAPVESGMTKVWVELGGAPEELQLGR